MNPCRAQAMRSCSVRRVVVVVAGMLMLGIFLSLGTPVQAAQVRGTVQTMDALDSAGATAYDQMRTGSGKAVTVCLAGLSTLMLFTGYVTPALMGIAGSLGSVFMQNATAGAYDNAPAATGVLEVLVPWVKTLEGFAGNRLQHDPVFYVTVGTVLLAVWASSRRQRSQQDLAT